MVEMKGELYPFYFKRHNFEITLEYLLWKIWNKIKTLDFSFNILTIMAFITYKFLSSIYNYFYQKVEDAPESWNLVCYDYIGGQEDTQIRPFRINVGNEVLSDLRVRLKETRFEEPIHESGFDNGFNSAYLQRVVEYWATRYDWRKEEEQLNKRPQFLTRIDGLDIHFMHVKPALSLKRNLKVLPLLLVHGFPGSAANFLKLIPMLTTTHPSQDFVFEVITPSIPGFGLSESPIHKDLSGKEVAKIFLVLMDRLDIKEFYILGCGWGAVVASMIGRLSPSRVKGVHVNQCFSFPRSFDSILRLLSMSIFPFLASKSERPIVYNMKKKIKSLWEDSRFHHVLGTNPRNLGYALSDSPAGMAACLLEKFLKEKTENSTVTEGKVFGEATIDDLLTMVTICWINNNFTSSARFYKKVLKDFTSSSETRSLLTVPVGISVFPNETLIFPQVVLEQHISDLISYNVMPRGGYMVSMEEPLLLAKDFMKFVTLVEERKF